MRNNAMNQKSLVMKIIKTPVRVLCKARDLYVKSMNGYASHTSYGMAGLSRVSALPRSFSTFSSFGSNDGPENLRELVRSNTTTDSGINRAELELYIQQHKMKQLRKVPRSCSVGMGRIDEERVYSFREDNFNNTASSNYKVKSEQSMYSRSRSNVVSN